MFNHSKRLILVLGCLAQLNVAAMDQADLPNVTRRQDRRSAPSLRQLSGSVSARVVGNSLGRTVTAESLIQSVPQHILPELLRNQDSAQAVAALAVSGNCLYRRVNEKWLVQNIPPQILPELRRLAQEYRDQHPGALPIIGNAVLKPLNADLLPQFHNLEQYGGRFFELHGNWLENWMIRLPWTVTASMALLEFVSSFDDQTPAFVRKEMHHCALVLLSTGLVFLSGVPAFLSGLAASSTIYTIAKPKSRNVVLGCLVGYALYRKLKR